MNNNILQSPAAARDLTRFLPNMVWVDTHIAYILRQMLNPRYVLESQLVVSKNFMCKDAGWENNELLHLIDGKCDGSCHEIVCLSV